MKCPKRFVNKFEEISDETRVKISQHEECIKEDCAWWTKETDWHNSNKCTMVYFVEMFDSITRQISGLR